MKKQVEAEQAIGQRLTGCVESNSHETMAYVFDDVYVLERRGRGNGTDSLAALNVPIDLDDFELEALATAGLASLEELQAMFADDLVREQARLRQWHRSRAEAALRSLFAVSLDDGRRLVAEAAEKYAVKP